MFRIVPSLYSVPRKRLEKAADWSCTWDEIVCRVDRLDAQTGHGIFGGGYLLTPAAAERLAAAERIEVPLSERERGLIETHLRMLAARKAAGRD